MDFSGTARRWLKARPRLWACVAVGIFCALAASLGGLAAAVDRSEYESLLLSRLHGSDRPRADATDIMRGILSGKTKSKAAEFLAEEEFLPNPLTVRELNVGGRIALTKELQTWGVSPFIFASDRVDVTLEIDANNKVFVVSSEVYQFTI